MNWTASLLRNELNKQKVAYEQRINLLTNASIDVQNFLELEEKVKELTASLKISEQSLTQIKKELKSKEQSHSEQIKDKELDLANLENKIKIYKDKIFNLNKQIREANLYHQRNLRQIKADYQTKLTPLTKQIAELKQSLLSIDQKKLKGKESQQQILTELQVQWNKEKEQLQRENSIQITELKQQVTNAEQTAQRLEKDFKKQEKQLTKITHKQEKVQQTLTNSQIIFQQIEKIINKDTTIVLASKKKIRNKVSEFKQLIGWGATEIEESEEEILSSPELTPLPEPLITTPPKSNKQLENWRTHGQPFLEFTEELTRQWINQGFTKLQCQAWLNIGMKATEADFTAWLRDIKHKDPTWVLNYGDSKALRTEFKAYDRK